jgi:glycosyltransferase involved in cell wall biosynthesis
VRNISIVLPARNETAGLRLLLPRLRKLHPEAEIVVVDDGSTDDTAQVAAAAGARVVSHPYSMGNGAAIKSGARAATGSILVFMDADGQHQPDDVARLLAKLDEGYDMAVGARAFGSQANVQRAVANAAYNRVASWMTGFRIDDLTSGFRAVRAEKFRRFLYLLPNGFSYPTTITMAFFRSAFPVAYVPIATRRREGTSNISVLKDGLRFFVIILKIGALFSPMRLFFPVSLIFFGLGIAYYSYTYFAFGRFTNMTALLFIAAMLSFLIGIVSEQVSSLHYKGIDETAARVPPDTASNRPKVVSKAH